MKLYLKIEGSRCHIKVDFHPRINSLLKSFEDHTYENNVYSYPIKYKDELISSLLALNLDVIECKSFPEKIEQKKKAHYKNGDKNFQLQSDYHEKTVSLFKQIENNKFDGDTCTWIFPISEQEDLFKELRKLDF